MSINNLAVPRIPMSRLAAHTPGSVPGHPVLHLHGYESSSAEVVLRGARNGLGFLLSDQGYDVWLINYRGNTYSRNHTVVMFILELRSLLTFSESFTRSEVSNFLEL